MCDRLTTSFTPLSSSAAVTVTVWAVLQVVMVKVSVFWSPDCAAVSTVTPLPAPFTVTVTLAVGWVFRRTV